MKKKKLLFIAPNYYGFNTVVNDGLEKYSNYEVTHIITNGTYIYKNFGERALNFLSKILLGKNLKHKWIENQTLDILNQSGNFDLLIANRPDVLTEKELEKAISISEKTCFLLWDSLDKIKQQKNVIQYFDVCCSFDSDDCKEYNFKKINNFYFAEYEEQKALNFDVCYLGTYDQRIDELIKIFAYLKNNNIKVKSKIFTYPSIKIKEKIPADIEVIHRIIPFPTSFKYYLDTKIIMDIAHENQKGLSFRPFEAIGLRKKLITTNKNIKNYDFYLSENIFVIEDIDNIEIPNDFFTTEYKDLPKDIEEKYFIKNWVEKICNI
ncbi:lipopolysaccharide core biosynthesis protein rfaS [Frigoriflavimonas asaccharolytica]|uniref:Uncharacterized protein n=1 Tax=Frigoriflavimonas asaccharolytica TaxID=2735899 RepID=A0A8J8K9S7_9FLAO|nr:lipopolysaccharide core biosynthesis protein rfaS [Frigoriflavimonas asaccharolytica]NRS93407.1 hypothetical protein [Frigoriflavimonas asaccharolytica]